METLRDYRAVPERLRGAVLAIGNFDGVHKGHQAVLRTALDVGQAAGRPTGVIVFEPHPRQFFKPDVALFRLTPLPLKLRLFAALGLDLTAVLDFDAALAALSAEDFVARVLVEGFAAHHVVTGDDFHFGKDRQGTPEALRRFAEAHGFAATIVAAVGEGVEPYSSSAIRALLRAGEPRAAADSLGYWWRTSGEVTGGAQRGQGLGFPTANLTPPPGFDLKHGIYAVRVGLGADRFEGAAYLGTRATFGAGEPALEVFLFDFDGDLYGREIEVEFIAYLRDDRTFDSAEALQAQIAADCAAARQVLAELAEDDPFARTPLGQSLAAVPAG